MDFFRYAKIVQVSRQMRFFFHPTVESIKSLL